MNKERREEDYEEEKTHSLSSLLSALLIIIESTIHNESSPSSHHVLVGNTEEVPLLVGELSPGLGDGLHGGSHVIVPLSLLGELSALNQFILLHC